MLGELLFIISRRAENTLFIFIVTTTFAIKGIEHTFM